MEAGETESHRQGEGAVTLGFRCPWLLGPGPGNQQHMRKTVLTEGTESLPEEPTLVHDPSPSSQGQSSLCTHRPVIPADPPPTHSQPGSPERWAFDLGQVLEMTPSSLYGRSNRAPRDQQIPAGGAGQGGSLRATSLPGAKRPGPAAPLGAESDLFKKEGGWGQSPEPSLVTEHLNACPHGHSPHCASPHLTHTAEMTA